MQTSTYRATTANGTCNAGDTLSGSICTHSSANAAPPSYSCPNGGTLTGEQCVGANSTRTAYIYLGGKQIAETVVDGVTQYAHTDALGSPVAHTDQAGAVLNRTKYEPYGYTAAGTKPGRTTAGLTTTGSAIGFTGHVNDPDTDLVYMQQRYYDPIAGRFLSVDPVTTDANTGGSFNRYAYANNSPYKYVDPDGRNAITKLIKQTIKHDGNVVKAAGDVISDVVTVVSPSSTALDRVEAVISLVSPVDVGDVKAAKNFFRGAKPGSKPDFTPKPGETKVDAASGNVNPTHGVSVFDNPGSVSSKGYTPHQVDTKSVPDSLQIQQRGSAPSF